MSKNVSNPSISIADLNTALKPLIEAINRLREEQTATSSQVTEIYQVVTSLSIKFDCVDQTTAHTLDELSKVTSKKGSTRKPAAKKPAAKKPAAKKTGTRRSKKTNDEDAADEVVADEGTDDAVVGEDTADDTADDKQEEKEYKKAAVKTDKQSVKKTLPKKVTVRTSTKKPQPVSRNSKMNIFKKAFKEDPDQFNEVLTSKVKKDIETENKEKWSSLNTTQLENAKISAYFHYIKDNHSDYMENINPAIESNNEDNESE